MKKLMTTIGMGLMIALISPAMAQNGKPNHPHKAEKNLSPEEKAQKRTDQMTKELDLSEEQAKKIYDINLEHAKEMESIKAEKEKLKKRAKTQRDKTKSEIDNVLNEEQKAKMEEIRKKRQEKKAENKGKNPHGEHPKGNHPPHPNR